VGLKTAVVSSSRNCTAVLETAGIDGLFDAKVDGIYAAKLNLKGKPYPDTFLEAARLLGVTPGRSVVFEDAVPGVQAGRNGKFGLVVGVDRAHHADDLRRNGADIVVTQLTEIKVSDAPPAVRQIDALPSALQHVSELVKSGQRRRLVFFLDYDGTLTQIVDRPELAILSDEMRATLKALTQRYLVAVISGRDLHDVQNLVRVDNLFYAGSHGFRITGPSDWQHDSEYGTEFLPTLDQVERELRERIEGVPGTLVERKHLSIAVHYRLVDDSDVPKVASIVDEVLATHSNLRMLPGKKVFDLQPDIDWNKGKAILWLLHALELDRDDVMPIYIGDDLTDEDAFQALRGRGLGIIVKGADRTTAANYALDDPDQVRQFFDQFLAAHEGVAHE
jgi:alpha,alpha-trehalase